MRFVTTDRIAALLGWLAVLSPSLLLRIYPAIPLAADEKVFAVVTRQLASGAVLYRDVFDHKGPALYWGFDLCMSLFGGSYLGVRVASIVASIVLQLCVYFVVRRWVRRDGPPLFASFAIGLGAWVTNRIFGVELWMTAAFALALALVLCNRGWMSAFVAGFASGFAVMIRPNGLADAVAVGVACFLFSQTNRVVRTAAYGSGLLACCVAFLVPLLAEGAGADTAYALLAFNTYYASLVQVDAELLRTLGRWLAIQAGVCWFLWLPSILAVARPPEDPKHKLVVRFLLVWSVFALASALLGKRPFNHYLLQPYLPMSLLAGLWASGLRLPSLTPRAVFALSSSTLVAFGLLGWFHVAEVRAPQRAYAAAEREVAKTVDALTGPGDRICVWGNATNIYWFSARAPATKYLYYPPFRSGSPWSPFERRYWQDWLKRFDRTPPAVVVDCSPTRWNDLPWLDPAEHPGFAERLNTWYRPAAELHGFRLYVLRSSWAVELR